MQIAVQSQGASSSGLPSNQPQPLLPDAELRSWRPPIPARQEARALPVRLHQLLWSKDIKVSAPSQIPS
jgi:hypothetical protein